MPLNQAKPGTILTADLWYAAPTSVILTLENGENRQYDVPKGPKFDVDGRMVEAVELRPGMKITATKVLEAPHTAIAQDAVVTGTTKK